LILVNKLVRKQKWQIQIEELSVFFCLLSLKN